MDIIFLHLHVLHVEQHLLMAAGRIGECKVLMIIIIAVWENSIPLELLRSLSQDLVLLPFVVRRNRVFRPLLLCVSTYSPEL